MQVFRYYLISYLGNPNYIEIDESTDISFWNAYSPNGKSLCVMWQNGESDLKSHEFLEIGRLLELHKQVKNGQLEYDPYLLWPSDRRPPNFIESV